MLIRIIFRGTAVLILFICHPDEEDLYRAHDGLGAILPVEDNDIIDLGNRPIKIISIPGHTPGSIAVLDINNRVLIGGDSNSGRKHFHV
jgi:hydroxyacylglutathione hydrolase